MAEFNAGMRPPTAELEIKVFRKNGTVEDLGVVSRETPPAFVQQEPARWVRIVVGVAIVFAVAGFLFLFASAVRFLFFSFLVFGLVTTAGVNYLMGTVLPASAIKWVDTGTGTTAATISDTAMETPTGDARVSGTQSNPGAGQYRVVALVPYTAPFSITEFGLFSASTGPTLWDRRVGFGPVAVGSGDSIQFQYTVTGNAGGS